MILQKLDLISKTHQIYFIRVREFIGNLVSLIFLTSKYSPSRIFILVSLRNQKSVKLGLRGGKGGLAALKRKVWLHPVERKWSHLRILHGPWSRLAYTRAHACQDTTEPGVETRRAALRRLVALHYYDIRHAWPALTIKPLFHLADAAPRAFVRMYDAAFTVTTRDFLFAFEAQLRFFFQRFGNWSSLRIFNFFSSTLTRRFLRIATRISYFVRWIKARQSNWILYYTEQSWKSLWNEISCRFDGIIKIIRNFSSFFFF